jgi:hypothetical protein
MVQLICIQRTKSAREYSLPVEKCLMRKMASNLKPLRHFSSDILCGLVYTHVYKIGGG